MNRCEVCESIVAPKSNKRMNTTSIVASLFNDNICTKCRGFAVSRFNTMVTKYFEREWKHTKVHTVALPYVYYIAPRYGEAEEDIVQIKEYDKAIQNENIFKNMIELEKAVEECSDVTFEYKYSTSKSKYLTSKYGLDVHDHHLSYDFFDSEHSFYNYSCKEESEEWHKAEDLYEDLKDMERVSDDIRQTIRDKYKIIVLAEFKEEYDAGLLQEEIALHAVKKRMKDLSSSTPINYDYILELVEGKLQHIKAVGVENSLKKEKHLLYGIKSLITDYNINTIKSV